MKTIPTLLVVLCCVLSAYCQVKEFEVYPNGLIYSEQTMIKLRHIADSLNLKYRSCNFNTIFYSKSQVVGHLVRVNHATLEEAMKDMNSKISVDDFLKKYPNSTIERNILILKSQYKNYKDKEVVEIEHFNLKDDYGFSIESEDVSLYQKDFSGQWLYKYTETSTYTSGSLTAFYFPENFRSVTLPEKYAKMIGYGDCLVDTSIAKFNDDLKRGWVDLPQNWKSLSLAEKNQLLDKMRSTRVVGTCSFDSRPRVHAMHIALVSAETYNWGIFLKAHLDILNDRFQRSTDGSYAQQFRNTYIIELEELNINVPDLILGSIFRIENPATNHYFGNVGRVGRALSETRFRSEIEQAILEIVSDSELDLYNRLLFYFLFRNYNFYIEDKTVAKENKGKLAAAIKTFPDFIAKGLSEED